MAGMSPYYQALRDRIGHDLILYPAVGGIIADADRRILLQSKTEEPGWFIPGGAVEPGEHPEVALVREIEEETGLLVKPISVALVFGGAEYRYEYPNGDRVEIVGALYHCDVIGHSEAPLDPETKSLEYFARDDMPTLRLPYPVDALFSRP